MEHRVTSRRLRAYGVRRQERRGRRERESKAFNDLNDFNGLNDVSNGQLIRLRRNNGQYPRLGFVKGRFGVGNQFLMFLIGRLHVSRYIEKPFEEGRGEVLKLKFLFL